MKLKLKPYEIPFVKPMQFGNKLLSVRKGIWICDENNNNLSEISPLENFSKESLEEAYEEAKLVIEKNINSQLPSVQWGFDALNLLSVPKTENVLINALIIGHPETWAQQISEQYNQGYRSFKIKIARFDFDLEIKNLTKINGLFKNLEIRLDANQKFEIREYLEFCENLEKSKINNISYIEEPVKNIWELLDLNLDLKYKLALDETLLPLLSSQTALSKMQSSLQPNDQGSTLITAFIIKPTLVGSIKRIKKLVSLAHKHNISCVFSSSFESRVGLRNITKLAHELEPDGNIAHGLGTYKYFKN